MRGVPGKRASATKRNAKSRPSNSFLALGANLTFLFRGGSGFVTVWRRWMRVLFGEGGGELVWVDRDSGGESAQYGGGGGGDAEEFASCAVSGSMKPCSRSFRMKSRSSGRRTALNSFERSRSMKKETGCA